MNHIYNESNPLFWAAVSDFDKARWRATLETMMAHLTGKSADLLGYEDVCQKLKFRGSTFRGLRDIPLDAIVGSVGRYTDFTRSFWPRRDNNKHRWAKVKAAMSDLVGLPPIAVYQIGPIYFVVDGHHRVSVARQLGTTHVEAYVTEIHTEVPLSPDFQPDELMGEVKEAETPDRLETGPVLEQGSRYTRPLIKIGATLARYVTWFRPALKKPLRTSLSTNWR